MSPQPLRFLPLFLVLLCIPMQADATVMRYADLDRLVETSHIIVHATVAETTTVEVRDGTLRTEIRVDVHETFLGKSGDELIVEQWGGETSSRRAMIPGDAKFKPQQEVILFLRLDPETRKLSLTALSQGVFEIHESEDGIRTAHRDLSKVSLLVPSTRDTTIDHHHEPAHELELFLDILRAVVSSHEETP